MKDQLDYLNEASCNHSEKTEAAEKLMSMQSNEALLHTIQVCEDYNSYDATAARYILKKRGIETNRVFRIKNFKRDYECTNIVACVADKAPSENYILDDNFALCGLTKLYKEGCVEYYGFL